MVDYILSKTEVKAGDEMRGRPIVNLTVSNKITEYLQDIKIKIGADKAYIDTALIYRRILELRYKERTVRGHEVSSITGRIMDRGKNNETPRVGDAN